MSTIDVILVLSIIAELVVAYFLVKGINKYALETRNCTESAFIRLREQFAITSSTLQKAYAQKGLCPICFHPIRNKQKITVCTVTGKLHPDVHPWSHLAEIPEYEFPKLPPAFPTFPSHRQSKRLSRVAK